MSCIKSQDQEPEFEPVTVRNKHHQRLINESKMVTANSSPKLRLSFDNQDELMTDTDFEEIIKKDIEKESSSKKHEAYSTSYRNLRQRLNLRPCTPPSPLLPPNLYFTVGGSPRTAIYNHQHQLSGLGLEQPYMNTNREEADGSETRSTNTPTPKFAQAGQADVKGKGKGRHTSTASDVLPRVGTLTALPGSKMAVKIKIEDEDEDDDQVPGPSATQPTTPVIFSRMLPPSIQDRTAVAPMTPQSNMPLPGHLQAAGHKRKLSRSAPFINNVKRILVLGGRKKHEIKHITHEATAGNRAEGGIEFRQASENMGEHGALTNISAVSDNETKHAVSRGRDLITPTFAGPSWPESCTPPDPSTNVKVARPQSPFAEALNKTINRFRPSHRRSATNTSTLTRASSTANDPTSKAMLNKSIIQLRNQLGDLMIENRVLKDQVGIVRRDWIETSQDLDIERHRSWLAEMEAYKLGVEVEELRREVGASKRGE